jgi:hypothetical protein
MKKFYNQDKIILEDLSDYQEFEFYIDIPSFYGLNYYQKLDIEMKKFFEDIPSNTKPTIFKMIGDFDILTNKDKQAAEFIVAIVNIFASHIITKEPMGREYRLAAPKSLENLYLNNLVKKDIINKKIRFPNFRIEVIDKNGKSYYEVM